ncbi:helix-hairpin-helix domain-containing protein [Fulvivirga ulvae]|uniref:ComEA family DNA-binding protein n=1 Tax=Fulvivirga ulvae TaxID=2904245 RepID=UPI001F2FFDC3|nr:helix-hairpin-helix domain-containing protein [Fulvivirga ulvae]UII34941.1 helix-hairpin-helix domain-containing protein [Fulvivirga ulvae]
MIKFQLWLRSVFGISKSESTGLLILLPLAFFLVFAPSAIKRLLGDRVDLSEEEHRLNELIEQMEVDTAIPDKEEFRYKMFDPNYVSTQELEQMGVSKAAANNWERYLASGGRFNKVGDIKKVYGLSTRTFDRIRDYVNIRQPADRELPPVYKKKPKEESGLPVVAHTRDNKEKNHPFDLNEADTITLKQLKGIGSVYSGRIVRYRESLGGFVSKDQLKEVWGLNDAILKQLDTLAYINDPLTGIRLLPVNDVTEQQLASHPYLSNKQAAAIVAYRYQHGKFRTVNDLYNIHRLDSLVIAKISPYLEF